VCVVGPADPHWGQVVTAVVVAAPGTTIDPDALRSAVAGTLGPAAAPHRVVQVDTLATLPSGKHDRAATARVAARKVNHG
jgi:acyl-CoA synthetase (AMP-forming)/AMP-acid ligase II